MNKNTYKYFKDRERKHQEEKIKDDEKFSKVLEKEYQRTLREIDNRINWWIGKYADDNVISVEQAKQIVTEADINELKEKAKEYVKNKDLSPKANKEMKIYNLKMKVARDELLQKYIDLELAKLGTKEEKLLEDRIFNETEEELKRQAGILGDSLISKNKVKNVFEQIVNDSHVSAHFSYYIWTNIKELRNDLQNGLNRSILRGQNPNVWKSDLYKYFKGNVKKAEFYARRLAVTETAIAQTKAGLISVKENGYDKVIIITEPGACKDCKPHDGNIVDIDEAEMGKNVPIWHPFCRCTIAAYYDYESDEELDGLISDEYYQKVVKNTKKGYNKYKELYKSTNENRKYYSKVSSEDFEKITHDFITNGGIIKSDEDAERYLDVRKADGICFNDKLIFLRPDCSYTELFEELEHASQHAKGLFSSDKINQLEISAKTKALIKSEKYKITDIEKKDLKEQIEYYKKLLKE